LQIRDTNFGDIRCIHGIQPEQTRKTKNNDDNGFAVSHILPPYPVNYSGCQKLASLKRIIPNGAKDPSTWFGTIFCIGLLRFVPPTSPESAVDGGQVAMTFERFAKSIGTYF
jgi:hypothetical protein